MIFDVYRLCQRGLPLPTAAAQARGPVRGDLRLSTQVAHARARLLAQLFMPGSEEHYALPVLMDAELTTIGAEGLLIKGTEVVPRGMGAKAKADYYPQRWLCKAPLLTDELAAASQLPDCQPLPEPNWTPPGKLLA